LFAAEFIEEGTVIGRVEGVETDRDGPYVLWVDGVRGFEVTNEFKYVNHAADANAAYFDDLTFVALRDIHPGEEITHNYTGISNDDDTAFEIDDEDWHAVSYEEETVEWEAAEDTAPEPLVESIAEPVTEPAVEVHPEETGDPPSPAITL
jgi:hypothetical protein